MTTTSTTSGAADLLAMVSKALREAYNLGQRYWQQADSEYISQHKKAGDTRAKFLALVEETCAALAAGQSAAAQPDDMGHKSIDMVLHCPKCGLQHIDKDNSEDLRIEAAELGVDREGDRELEHWIEEREWTNPPHRSHLCASCKHIWRPADVCTNGVLAVKTKGQEDSPIEEVATRIYGGGRGVGKANNELHQLINEVHRENID